MKPKFTLGSLLSIASSAVLTVSYAHAASIYWDGINASWNTNTNWSTASGTDTPDPASVPGALDDVIFNITTVNGAESITLDANQAAKSLTFNNTGTTTLLGGGSSRTLALGTGGITMAASAGAVTLGDGTAGNDVLISLTTGARTLTNNSGANFTINNSAASFSRVAGATLGFNKVGAGDFSMSTTVLPNDATGIVGAWAHFGTGGTQRYAFNNAGTIADYTGGTAAADANAFASATTNYDLTSAAISLTGNRTANTFRSAGAGGAIDLGSTGANTLTTNGILAVGSGTLSINRTGGTGTVVIGASNELVIAGSQAVTIGAPISGTSKSLTYSGTNTLTLGGSSTFNGGINVNSGTVAYNAGNTLAGTISVATGATLQNGTAFGVTTTFSGAVINNGSITRSGNGTTTFGGSISGTGSVTHQSSAGTVNLNANNTFTGGLNVNGAGGGTNQLNLGNNGSLGAGTFTWGGGPSFNINVANWVNSNNNAMVLTANLPITGSYGTADFGTGSVTLGANVTITNSNPVTVGGAIGQSGGTRTLGKAGAGTLVLGGSTSNTYGGLTSVTAGTLQLGKSGTANAIAAGGISVGTGTTVTYTGASTDMIANAAPVTVTGTGQLNLNGVSDTIGALGLTAAAANNALVTTGAGTLTLGGNVTFTAATTGTAQISGNLALGAATRTFTVGAGTGLNQDLLVSAPVSGSGVGIIKAGTGRMTLSATNAYDGGTTVNDGRLIATSGSALGSGDLTIAANKSFAYLPSAAGALSIAGALNLGSGTTTNIGTALGGTASQSVTAVTGAASLAGTGVVNVNLIPGVAPTVGTNNLITAASGLDGGTYTLGAVYNNTNFTLSNFTRSATAISVDVTAATPLSGGVFWKGGLAGNTGVWSASNGTTTSNWQVTDGVNQPIAPGATADLIFSAATSPGTMVGMSLGSNVSIRSLTINNTATAFSLNADGNTLTIGTGGITIGAGVQASSISTPVVLGAAQTWTNNSGNALSLTADLSLGANNLTFAGSGNFIFTTGSFGNAGSGGIIMNGTGLLNLRATANTNYTGSTVINNGTLMLNGGSKPSGNFTLNGGMLTDYFQQSGVFSGGLGAGNNQIQIYGDSGFGGGNGTSNWTIGAANSVLQWGSTYFNPTTLKFLAPGVDNMGPSIHGLVTLNNGLDLNGAVRTIAVQSTSVTPYSNTATITGVISNSSGTASGLTKTGAGRLILSAANTFNGTTTISNGVLSLNNALALQNSVLDTTNSVAGTANVGLRTTQTTLTLGGLTGNKNFAATGGVFDTTAGGYGSVTALTLNPAAADSHSYSGIIANGAANMSLTKNGAGTQTLAGASTYSGTTTVSNGTLIGTNATQSFGTNLSGISIQGAGTLSLRNDSSVSFTNGTSAYNIATSASGATVNVDRVTGTGSNTLTIGNLPTSSTAVTWQLNFTGANGVGLNAGSLTTPTAAAGSHTINNNIAGGGSLTLAGVTGGGTGAAATIIVTGSGNTTVSGAITQTATAQALTKNGAGALLLNGTNTYTGTTTVNAGTLGGTGTIAGAVTVAAAGNLAPGASVGTLTINNNLTVSAMAGGTGVMTYELGPIASSDKIAITGTLDIGVGTLGFNNFAFSNAGGLQNGTYKLITSGAAVTGSLDGANLTGSVGSGSGTLQINGNDLELVVTGIGAGSPYDSWATSKGLTGANNAKTDDPDKDGSNNLAEFAFNGDPLSGSDNGQIAGLVQNVSAPTGSEMTLIVAVRDGATFSSSGSPVVQTATIDGVTYTIQGTLDLVTIPGSAVSKIPGVSNTAPLAASLPDLSGTDWEYHTFKLDASEGLPNKGFLRAKATAP